MIIVGAVSEEKQENHAGRVIPIAPRVHRGSIEGPYISVVAHPRTEQSHIDPEIVGCEILILLGNLQSSS